MSRGKRPDQEFYRPPIQSQRRTSSKTLESSKSLNQCNIPEDCKKEKQQLCKALSEASRNPIEEAKIVSNEPEVEYSNPIGRSIADRLAESLLEEESKPEPENVSKPDPLSYTKGRSLHLSKSRKSLPSLQVYVPPHKRGIVKNGSSDSITASACAIEDPYQNFRSTRRSVSPSETNRAICSNNDEVLEQLSHVLEVTELDSSLTSEDLVKLFNVGDCLDVRWINDTSALVRFPSTAAALEVLHDPELQGLGQDTPEAEDCSQMKYSAIKDASAQGKKKAFAIAGDLKILPEKHRPETTDFFARQVIGRHLGITKILPSKSSGKATFALDAENDRKSSGECNNNSENSFDTSDDNRDDNS